MAAVCSRTTHKSPPEYLQVRQSHSCASCSNLSKGWVQAERERRRMLARLREAREARTGPHRPRWFDFHPEVFCSMLMSIHRALGTRSMYARPDSLVMRYIFMQPAKYLSTGQVALLTMWADASILQCHQPLPP